MGRALLQGWFNGRAGAMSRGDVIVIDPDARARQEAESSGAYVSIAPSKDSFETVDTIVLAVKPQSFESAAGAIAPFAPKGAMLISIMAGPRISDIAARFPGCRVVRAMPNTPALIGAGITVYVCADDVTEAQAERADALLKATGEAIRADQEAQLDAVTAVSGSGPAYVFALAEAMVAAGVAEGLDREFSRKLVHATIAGAGALLVHDDSDAAALREAVTSPGGTTQAALNVLLDDDGLSPLVGRAITAATKRSRELGD